MGLEGLAVTARRTLLLNCTVVDPLDDAPSPGCALLIEDGRIAAAGDQEDVAAAAGDAEAWDLGGAFLLPGLMNMHVHLGLVLPGMTDLVGEVPAARALRMAQNARETLQAGVTTVRLVGEYAQTDFAVRNAIERGRIEGPRIWTAGAPIICTGGHGHGPAGGLEADGPDELRKAVRSQLKLGADLIKIMISGGIAGRHETIDTAQLDPEEMRAVTTVAHGWGKKVAAHAGPAGVISDAIDAGVDCIEHGYFLTPEVVEKMVEHGTWLVPTIVVSRAREFYDKIGAPEWMVERALAAGERHFAALQTAVAAGVRIAMGTDMLPAEAFEGSNGTVREMEYMVEAGMSPLDTIRAATIRAAELLGVDHELGRPTPGMLADLIAVGRNPAEDISALADVRLVMKGGEIFRREASVVAGAPVRAGAAAAAV
jgi:imidazolonepropionase-like amidohydrolase